MGSDWQIILTGGAAHIGAVAICPPSTDPATNGIELPGHREGELAKGIARQFAQALNCNVCVTAGIHFENISRKELLMVEEMACNLAKQSIAAIQSIKRGRPLE